MARAKYFDRAVQAAHQVLNNLDQEAFFKKIDTHRVGIAFDSHALRSEGEAALDLTIRLLARFYPKIAIIPLEHSVQEVAEKYSDLARAINPRIAIINRFFGLKDIIIIGNTLPPISSHINPIYIGSDGWIAKLSRKKPVGSMATRNPFGAGIASCLAAANIFRNLFSIGQLDDEIEISVLDLKPKASHPLNPNLGKIDLGKVFLIGAGAIGNGFLWALSRHAELTGQLAVVDHDTVDLFNLQRYVMTEIKDKGLSKTQMAADLFADHPGIHLTSINSKWEAFVSNLPDDKWNFMTVVSALDTPEDRIYLQASLPKWVVNAWTGVGDAGVSHHDFINNACMACLYMPSGEVLNEDQLIAQALGFPQDRDTLMEIRTRIETSQQLDREFLERISASKGVQIDKLLPFEGKTLRSLYSQGVCSGAVMELTTGPSTQRAEVPMPFQSAFAGILEAVLLTAHASGSVYFSKITRINLMGRFPSHDGFSWDMAKDPRCFCNDKDFRDVYLAKY